MKFRKKPVEIDAWQFTMPPTPMPQWLSHAIVQGCVVAAPIQEMPRYLTIYTLEGPRKASEGDWIIRGVKGELYPCKPDIFNLTYEAVND